MKSLITLAALLVASGSFVSAAAATTTFTSTATNTPSAQTFCDPSSQLCPTCDNQNIADASGTTYTVVCNSTISSTDQYEVTNSAPVSSSSLCMEACDELNGCLGASYSQNGTCVLATGEFLGFASGTIGYDGYVAFRRYEAPSASPTSFTQATSSAASHKASGSVFASSTAGSTNTSGACNASAISCPACDNEVVTDDRGKSYKVHCDNQLFAGSDYSIQQWTSPSGCLLECDDYTWCKGATFWPQGNCELAKGSDVFPQDMPGYTAFLPVVTGTAVKAPATSPSRFPTFAYTSVRKTKTSSHLTFQTVTLTGPSASTTASCVSSAARCPECEGETVKDAVNSTYIISCSAEPVCQNIVNTGRASQDTCMTRCDADPVCFAALWDSGECHLCEQALDGLVAFDAPAAYVVFLAEPVANLTTSVVSLNATQPTGTRTRPTGRPSAPSGRATMFNPLTTNSAVSAKASQPTAHSSSLTGRPPRASMFNPLTTNSVAWSPEDITFTARELSEAPAATGVSCPSDDNTVWTGSTDGRAFNVQCDTGFSAANVRTTSAVNFEACAALCTGDCGGIDFDATRCGLYTSISVVSSAVGSTAGVYIMYPGSTAITPAPTSAVGQQGQPFITASAPSSAPYPAQQAQKSVTAAAPSRTGEGSVSITMMFSALGVYSSAASAPSTTSSASFVPPLTNGSVSYATPGGETRMAA